MNISIIFLNKGKKYLIEVADGREKKKNNTQKS